MAMLRKCLGKKSEEGEESDEEEEEEGLQRRNSLQILNHKRALNCFIVKALVAKIIQQLITLGYAALIVGLPDYYSRMPPVYVFIPLSIWFFIFVWAHFVKSAPNFLISLFLLFISVLNYKLSFVPLNPFNVKSLCAGYFIAEVYHIIRFYFMFLPATFVCLLLTNVCFLPFMLVSKLWLNLKHIPFYLIPQLINLVLNIVIAVAWSVLVTTEKVSFAQTLEMRSKLDAILLLCGPTLFWSFSLNLVKVKADESRIVAAGIPLQE